MNFSIFEKTALCFFLICIISTEQNQGQNPQFFCLVPVRVRIGCLTSEVINMMPILKAEVSGVLS